MTLEMMVPTSGERVESEEDLEGEGKVVGVGEVVDEVSLSPFFLKSWDTV